MKQSIWGYYSELKTNRSGNVSGKEKEEGGSEVYLSMPSQCCDFIYMLPLPDLKNK